jgi:HK97 gp10 family phage protein
MLVKGGSNEWNRGSEAGSENLNRGLQVFYSVQRRDHSEGSDLSCWKILEYFKYSGAREERTAGNHSGGCDLMAYERTTWELKGLPELLKKVAELPREFSIKMEKTVLKKALQKVFDLAVANVPVGETGNLAKGLSLVTRKDKGAESLTGSVVNKAPHAHLVEFGHVMKGHEPNKKFIKIVPAYPFLRPAFNSQIQQMLQTAEEEMLKQFEKFKKKNNL